MFAPTKVWRRWHVKLSLGQKRFATASAIAASASAPLLLARGHRISNVPEVPFVVSSSAFKLAKTSAAVKLLAEIGAAPDIAKVKKSKKLRAGKGKIRGRRWRQRRGPLIVFNPETDGKETALAFRNIPGVEVSSVFALNLLQLAPGGHLGRFIIWTSSAFEALDKVYGSTSEASALKKDFLLPSATVAQPDIAKLINSSEIQTALRPTRGSGVQKRGSVQKKNPLNNKQVLLRLNPYAAQYAKDKLGSVKAGGKPEPKAEGFKKLIHEN
jgi:large subunit ribosomal protein L4e